MDYKETVEQMLSDDYRERFKAEYYQTKIRHDKLRAFNIKIRSAKIKDEVGPKHDCPDYLLIEQEQILSEYLKILELRAAIERIDLTT